jgi:hypothetical protein
VVAVQKDHPVNRERYIKDTGNSKGVFIIGRQVITIELQATSLDVLLEEIGMSVTIIKPLLQEPPQGIPMKMGNMGGWFKPEFIAGFCHPYGEVYILSRAASRVEPSGLEKSLLTEGSVGGGKKGMKNPYPFLRKVSFLITALGNIDYH